MAKGCRSIDKTKSFKSSQNYWLKISSKKGKVFKNIKFPLIFFHTLFIIYKVLNKCLQFSLTDLKHNTILYTDLRLKSKF